MEDVELGGAEDAFGEAKGAVWMAREEAVEPGDKENVGSESEYHGPDMCELEILRLKVSETCRMCPFIDHDHQTLELIYQQKKSRKTKIPIITTLFTLP